MNPEPIKTPFDTYLDERLKDPEFKAAFDAESAFLKRLDPLMSSVRDSWNTPRVVLDRVRRVDRIAFDPCSNSASIVDADDACQLPERDGLLEPWTGKPGLVFVNPPYGREIEPWVRRCAEQSVAGAEIIALVPSRTDTKWFQSWCAPPVSDAVVFWKGRLTFLGAPAPAPFPNALVYWGERRDKFLSAFAGCGAEWFGGRWRRELLSPRVT